MLLRDVSTKLCENGRGLNGRTSPFGSCRFNPSRLIGPNGKNASTFAQFDTRQPRDGRRAAGRQYR